MKFRISLIALLLVVVSCGDDDTGVTSSTIPPESSTTAGETTTTTGVATTEAITTTTEAATTTTLAVPDSDFTNTIVFVKKVNGVGRMVLIDPDTGEMMAVTDPDVEVATPRWSPDRTRILYWTYNTGEELIWSIGPDGTDNTQITDFSSANADWHPSGTAIIFNNDSEGEPKDVPDVAVMNLDGTGFTQVVDSDPTYDFGASWAPDGTRFLWISNQSGGSLEVLVAEADGSGVLVVSGVPTQVNGASWSPDGHRIAFAAMGPDGDRTDIYIVDADGANQVRLTDDEFWYEPPVWSPDGTWLAYTSTVSGAMDLWVMRVDGTDARQLTDDPEPDLYPDWAS